LRREGYLLVLIQLVLDTKMKLVFKILLLIGVFTIIGHCEEATEEAEESPDGALEGDEAMEGDEGGEEGQEGEEGEEGDVDADEDQESFPPLSPEEATALHKNMDGNANGKVSLAELTDFAHKMRRKMAQVELNDVMAGMDTDKDKKLDFKEFLGDPGKHAEETQNEKAAEFRSLDANNDKFLDADELTMLFQHHTNDKTEDALTAIAMKDKDKDKNGKLSLTEFYQHLYPDEPDEEDEPVVLTDEDKDIFNKLDLDGDGALTLKELKAWESGSFQSEAAVKKIFATADKDKDNHVTADELQAAREELASDPDIDSQMYLSMWSDHHKQHGEL